MKLSLPNNIKKSQYKAVLIYEIDLKPNIVKNDNSIDPSTSTIKDNKQSSDG